MNATTRTLAGVLVLVCPALAWLSLAAAPGQSVTAKLGQTTPFNCGSDQSLSQAIPVTWINVVLAGDGRLYVPCPGPGGHVPEHREMREGVLLNEALQSSDAEVRWRAVQALVRISLDHPLVVSSTTDRTTDSRIAPLTGPKGPTVVEVDGIGALTHSMLIKGACRNEAQVFDGASDAKRWQPGRFFVFLRDLPTTTTTPRLSTQLPVANSNNPQVKREAAYALGVRLSQTGLETNIVTAASRELQACFRVVPDAADLILEDIGLARYETEDMVREAETFLVMWTRGSFATVLGGARGLEALYRQHGQYQISQSALLFLRQLARYGSQIQDDSPDARVRRLALMALQTAKDHDTATLRAATVDVDWQVRRMVAGSLNLSDAEQARLGQILQEDFVFQVRYELLASVSRLVRETRECAPLLQRFKDVSPAVVMRAMDLLVPTCTDLDETVKKLTELTDKLTKPDAVYDWHIVARALAALTRVKPEAAQTALVAAAKHDVWQVRATAAAASVDAKDEALAVRLARDPEPNVRTAALDALFRMRSAELVPAAINVLNTTEDYQALRMAAMVLKGLPAEAKEEASDALLTALRKLTGHESDTSRDPRIAIIERLAETLDPSRSFTLMPFALDFDDKVNLAIAKTLTGLANAAPVVDKPKRRYPYQPFPYPPDAGTVVLPTTAFIELEEGTVTMSLLTDVAPVTVARFAELASQGYYNGLTFHRVVPNFYVQGGSPGANDYAGAARFMRDEVGPQGVHVRGAVGISTRGGDTGDGQFFIDLVDLPRFDRDYTVFAYVTGGMQFVDKLLEGAVIKGVSVR